MKTSRRRLDVNVEELDRVIDAAENGPLSNADRQKLKTTLHALVERLAPKRNTEKTNSVLEPKTSSSAATESPEPAGHGRNAASAFTGAEKISVQHAQPTMVGVRSVAGRARRKFRPHLAARGGGEKFAAGREKRYARSFQQRSDVAPGGRE